MTLPPFETEALLSDIRIEPAGVEREKLPAGGPIWPPEGAPPFLRTLRGGQPVGAPVQPGTEVAERIETPAVWCGYAVRHFGHFLAEQAPRLLAARRRCPDSLYVFLAPPHQTAETLPGWFWDILGWYGLPRAQVRIVTGRPVELATLRVFPQAEHLVVGPQPGYLDALDALSARRLPDVTRDLDHVYVSRAGMGPGKLGGEDYLEQRLIAAGVTVIRPETLPLSEQLRFYARARMLIFAEGSAVHGRQLLGRIDQHIAVVSRRKGWSFAAALLRPRAAQVTHLDTLHGSLHFSLDARGQPKRWEAFAFVKGQALLDRFRGMGIDLRQGWDMPAFDAAQEEDMKAWASRVSRHSRPEDLEARLRLLQGAFLAIGQEARAAPLMQMAREIGATRS